MNIKKFFFNISLKKMLLMIAALSLSFSSAIYLARISPRARRFNQIASTAEMHEKSARGIAEQNLEQAEQYRMVIEKLETMKKTATNEKEKNWIDDKIKSQTMQYNKMLKYRIEALKQANWSKKTMEKYRIAAKYPWMAVEPDPPYPD